MSQHPVFVGIALAATTVVVACSSPVASTAGHHDAGTPIDGGPPDELSPIELTIWAIQGYGNTDGGLVPLDHAKVCVPYARPIGKAKWSDFAPTTVKCVSQAARDAVALHAVPAMSELIVTADADGYRGAVFAVTTGLVDEDVTASLSLGISPELNLEPLDKPWVASESSVQLDSSLGDVTVHVGACALDPLTCSPLAGASLTLVNIDKDGGPAGVGPFYAGPSGSAVPGQKETLPNVGAASFVNLQQGDYLVRVTHPRAKCRVGGYAYGNADDGYTGGLNAARVPVLLGYSTRNISLICFCDSQFPVNGSAPAQKVDASTCTTISDAGGRD